MTSPSASATWLLPTRVTVDTVTALFHERSSRPAAIQSFDLSQVEELDSAGVALLHWFRARQRALGLVPAAIIGDASERYLALCQAHRLAEPQTPSQ